MQSKLAHVGNSTRAWALKVRRTCFFHEDDPSTNLWARQDSTIMDEPAIYLTNHQTKGKGRGTNTWQNPPAGDSLLASWKFQLNRPARHVTSPVIGLGLYEAAKETWPNLPWSLKAPNDLYLGDKKVAGLLVESVMQGAKNTLIIGIGLNVLSAPENLEIATCVNEGFQGRAFVTTGDWHKFLGELDRKWNESMTTITRETLSGEIRQQLLVALNQNPHLKEKYQDLTPDGDLVTASGTISWKDV